MGDLIEEYKLVKSRLLYEGELPPSGNSNRRPAEKHEIRRKTGDRRDVSPKN